MSNQAKEELNIAAVTTDQRGKTIIGGAMSLSTKDVDFRPALEKVVKLLGDLQDEVAREPDRVKDRQVFLLGSGTDVIPIITFTAEKAAPILEDMALANSVYEAVAAASDKTINHDSFACMNVDAFVREALDRGSIPEDEMEIATSAARLSMLHKIGARHLVEQDEGRTYVTIFISIPREGGTSSYSTAIPFDEMGTVELAGAA